MRINWVNVLFIFMVAIGFTYASYHAPEPGDQAKYMENLKKKSLGKQTDLSIQNGDYLSVDKIDHRGYGRRERRVGGVLFNEDFENTFPPTGWTTEVLSGSINWEQHLGTQHPSGYDAHSGSYVAVYNSYSASSGSHARLITDTIDLSDVTDPQLVFWFFRDNGYSSSYDSLVVEIKSNIDGSWSNTWTPLASFLRYSNLGDYWEKETIDLSAYQGASIIIAFHAYSDWGNSIHIDDVSIEYPYGNDVGVTDIIAPAGVYSVGDQITPQVVVKNFGTNENTFDVYLNFANYSEFQSVTLAAGSVDTVSFPSYTLTTLGDFQVTAFTSLASDEDNSNDTLTSSFNVYEFVYEFETSNGSFQADPQTGAWEWGTPTTGPSSAHSGDKCWGTLLDDYYSNNADWYLYSPMLHALSDNPTLSFYQWYHIEYGYDGGNVEISTDGGQTWTLIEPVGGYPVSYISALGDKGFSGYSGGWQCVVFDLSNYVSSGDYFQVRFHFASDYSFYYEGWYIDDFAGMGFEVFVPSYDVGVNRIFTPIGCYSLNDTVTPSAEVQNFGNTDADFSVTLKIYKGSNEYYSETQNVSLSTGAIDTVYFNTLTLNTQGLFDVVVYTTYSQDVSNVNDTSSTRFFIPNEVNDFNLCLFPPIGWASYIIGDSLNIYGEPTGWDLWTDTTHYGHGDPYDGCSIWHNDDNVADSCNDWIVKGPIYVADSNAAIAFYQSGYWISYTHYHGIWISVNDPDPRNGNFSELVDLTDSTPTTLQWSLVGPLTQLGDYVGDTVYIAFVYRGDYADEWYIDNVMLIGAYSLPNDIIVGGTPIASHDTLGLGTTTLYSYVWNPPSSPDSLTFRLYVTITHNGIVVYNHFATVSQLAPGETRIVYFSPDFVPYESGEYIYTITAAVENDPFQTNNTIVDTFYVDLYGGGQSGETMIPRTFSLKVLSPNPLKGPVTLSFDVAKTANISLKIYDVSGRTMADLASGVYNPGRYTLRWDGKNGSGSLISEGIYFIEYRAGEFKTVKKIVILR